MCGQMRQFLDATGQLWAKGALIGKVGSVISSSATQHGGQESTILTFHPTLLHQGMVIVGLPYSFDGQTRMDEITGGSPYGASTISGGKGERMPSENELAAAPVSRPPRGADRREARALKRWPPFALSLRAPVVLALIDRVFVLAFSEHS